MWNLESPDITDVREHLDTIFPTDTIPVVATEEEKDAVEALYALYLAECGRPSNVLLGNEISTQLRQALHDAYKEVREKGKLSALRDALKLLANECPYCGFGQIQDLDHHLPKAVYRPLSIFPLNLVPCCATCNRSKPRKPREEQGQHLLHAYLENVSTYDFLVADVDLDPTNGSLQVRFNIAKPDEMGDELHSRLVNHLKEFNLQERYPAQVNIYLSGLETAFEQAFWFGGADGLRMFLLRSADKNAQRFGINDWRTALLRGLAASEAFCDGGFDAALGYEATAQRHDPHDAAVARPL